MIFHFKVNRNNVKTYDHCFYSDSKHILYKNMIICLEFC